MSFSKTSEVIMKYFLNDFDKYSKKISSRDQESLDKIFKQFWWDIKISDGLIERYDKNDMLNTKLVQRKKYTELFESNFVPSSIKRYVDGNMKGYLHMKTYLCNVEVEVIYADFDYPYEIESFIKYMPPSDGYDPSTHSQIENINH